MMFEWYRYHIALVSRVIITDDAESHGTSWKDGE